jgi:hypothetical protein
MDEMEQMLKRLEGVDWRKVQVFVGIFAALAVVLLYARHLAISEAQNQGLNEMMVKTQQQHFQFHEDMRKKLIAMAKVHAQPAIDLLRALEEQDGKAQAH